MKSFYVLWVRHCTSCSNVATSVSRALFVEPFCTSSGIPQSLVAGENIAKFVKDYFNKPIPKIKMYSSVLPRAMETSKLISEPLKRKGMLLSMMIKRLPYISENWIFLELLFSDYNDEDVGSANTTTVKLSDANAHRLNECLKGVGVDIEISDKRTHTLKAANGGGEQRCAYKDGYYHKFLTEVIPAEMDPKCVNVVTGHGWYIYNNVLLSADFVDYSCEINSSIKNTEAYLVRYDYSGGGILPVSNILARLNAPPEDAVPEGGVLPPAVVELMNSDLGTCSY